MALGLLILSIAIWAHAEMTRHVWSPDLSLKQKAVLALLFIEGVGTMIIAIIMQLPDRKLRLPF